MNRNPGKCILCNMPAQCDADDPMTVSCERCGRYEATYEFSTNIDSDNASRPYLSAATRQAWSRQKTITLHTDYLALVEEHRWTSVNAKARKILEYLQAKSAFFSEAVRLSHETDYPLFDAVSAQECFGLMEMLAAKGHIEQAFKTDKKLWKLTIDGWNLLEPLHAGGIPGRCFVAMAFDESLDDAYYHGIKPAIEEAGYESVCMKERLTNDNICDIILAEIRKAQFVVADFTKQKGGVYFEAGFAKALGKEVFWTCHESDFDKLHFDTNHYGHLKWTTAGDLKAKLQNWIVAELGIGPRQLRRA
jgi:hypothetical protein